MECPFDLLIQGVRVALEVLTCPNSVLRNGRKERDESLPETT